MKRILLSALLLAATMTVGAVRPMHKLFPVKQNDGTTVMLYKHGDGHLAFYTTEDDKVVVRDADGRLCYGLLDASGNLTASAMPVHNVGERTADERAFVSSITLKPSDEALRPLLVGERMSLALNTKKAGNASTSDGLGKYGTQSGGAVPSIGNITIPVIMVAYQDKDFLSEHTTEKISRYFNEEGYNEDNNYEVGSVKDYFKAQSYGHFVPTFDVVAKVTLDHPYAYYGANQTSSSNRGASDIRARQMVEDAIAKAVAQGVDFSKYYVDNRVPNITIMYAGQGEATGGDENTIWPHESDLTSWATNYQSLSGYNFGSYFVGNELYGETNIMGIGVFCHEFSHALGLPDWYVTDYSYSDDSPFGYWSVMDGGEYNGYSYAPVGYTAYERSYMGWLDIRELSSAEAVTLENPKDSDATYAVMFRNPSSNNEYFILENRQPDTWYPTSMGSGLMVTRIAFNRNAWMWNIVNNTQSSKRAMVVTANGSTIGAGNTLSDYGNANHLFGNGINYKEEWSSLGGGTISDKQLYKVIKHDNGSVTLSFRDKTLSPAVVETNGKIFEKVTDVSQLSSGDSIIFVNENEAVALSTTNYGAHRGAINVGVANGIASSNDEVLVFDVLKTTNGQNWGFHCSAGYLNASSTGVSLSRTTTNAMTDITIADGNATVHFVGRLNRYLGYETPGTYFTSYTSDPANIQIYRLQTSVDGISSIKVDNNSTVQDRVYNLKGQFVGNTLNGLQKGIYIQNGKKVVVR